MSIADSAIVLGKGMPVYTAQTILKCGGDSVADLVQAAAPCFQNANPFECVYQFIVSCTHNPRAGQTASNGYVVPEYNSNAARVLINLLIQAVLKRETFDPKRHVVIPSRAWIPVLDAVNSKIAVSSTPLSAPSSLSSSSSSSSKAKASSHKKVTTQATGPKNYL